MPWCNRCDAYNSRDVCPCKPWEVFECDVDLRGNLRSQTGPEIVYAYRPELAAERYMEQRFNDSGSKTQGLLVQIDGDYFDCEVQAEPTFSAEKRQRPPPLAHEETDEKRKDDGG